MARSRSTRGREGRPILRRSRGDDSGVGACCPRASDLPKEIERPRAWAPPARRSEDDFALERGETFTDRWLRLRAAGLGDEVEDRRHARGARGSVETLQKLVYFARAMTRVRGVGRVEGVRVDPLSMTVSRGAPTIGSRLSRKGERGARPDRSLREQSQDARGTPYGAHAEQMPRARRRNAEAHCRREPAALESRGKCGSEWTGRGYSSLKYESCGLQTSVVRTGVAGRIAPTRCVHERPRRGCARASVKVRAREERLPSSELEKSSVGEP